MKRLTAAKLDALEAKVKAAPDSTRVYSTVFGIVCPERGHLYNLMYQQGEWARTDVVKADVYIAAKLECVLKTTKRFVVVIGGRGCVHGDTLLDTPNGKIAIKDFEGGEVYSQKDGRVVIAAASKPAKFAAEDLFEVTLENGLQIICTDEHKFLTDSGWSTLSSLSVGDGIFSCHPSELSHPHHSSLDTCLLKSLSSVQRLTRKLVDCLDDYFLYHHQCDLQLQSLEDSDQVSPPLPTYEQQHSCRALCRADGSEFFCKHSLSSALCRQSSQCALQGAEDKSCASLEIRNAYKSFERLSAFYLQFPQSQQCINLMLQALQPLKQAPDHDILIHLAESLERALCTLQRVSDDSSFVVNSSVVTASTLTQIKSIRNHSHQEYWDLHVAETNCYFANGVLNHNSGKSVQVLDVAMAGVKDLGDKVYCLREFQNSLEDSVHSLITTEYNRLGFDGFSTQNNIIFHESGGEFKFKGMARNPASIKSAAGFRRFLVEEAQTISKESLEQLTPTARNKARAGLPLKFLVDTEEQENEHISDINQVQLIFIANPASSADPFSQRFIVPFKHELERNGFYEDELHLIVQMNHSDNPWFEESGLEAERQYDMDNLPAASYRHVWEGDFNDHVDNALIPSEWFNACIDAHIKLGKDGKPGFIAQGAKVAALDPSDQGADAKGFAMRQGSVVTQVKEILHGDAYQGCDTALGWAFTDQADYFIWDADGLGATLRQHISNIASGKRVVLQMFKGSESVDNPDSMYSFDNKGVPIRNAARNADVFRNKRAQYYWSLRDRFYATYRAVTRGEYIDPDNMISLDSSGIENIDALRSEVCRIPLKDNNNGFIQVMSKIEMKALKIPSPNMADALMMAFANTSVIVQNRQNMYIPRPMPKMGRR